MNKALETWREKLEELQVEHAIAADPAIKFNLKKRIEEAQREIAGLEAGAAGATFAPHGFLDTTAAEPADVELRQTNARSDAQRISVHPDTCLAFVDRSDEVMRCRERLDEAESARVLTMIIAGRSADWPSAVAYRLQAETPGNRVLPREHLELTWPPPDLNSRERRGRNLERQIQQNWGSNNGQAQFTAAHLAFCLNDMSQRGQGQIVLTIHIPADRWMPKDAEVLEDHLRWWNDLTAELKGVRVILLLAIIHSEAETKRTLWPFGRKAPQLTAAALASALSEATSLMGDRSRLRSILKDDLNPWGGHLEKTLKILSPLRIKLENAGKEVLQSELPHDDFRLEVQSRCGHLFDW